MSRRPLTMPARRGMVKHKMLQTERSRATLARMTKSRVSPLAPIVAEMRLMAGDLDPIDPVFHDDAYIAKLNQYIGHRVRSESARNAALARWRGTYKADRQRYARAIRQGKPAPRVRKWRRKKVRRSRENKG